MNIDEILTYLDNEIQIKKNNSKNSFYILSIKIVDSNINNIEEYITKYYNNQSIACKIKRCNISGEYEISIWW
jgi:hypothetical protein